METVNISQENQSQSHSSHLSDISDILNPNHDIRSFTYINNMESKEEVLSKVLSFFNQGSGHFQEGNLLLAEEMFAGVLKPFLSKKYYVNFGLRSFLLYDE